MTIQVIPVKVDTNVCVNISKYNFLYVLVTMISYNHVPIKVPVATNPRSLNTLEDTTPNVAADSRFALFGLNGSPPHSYPEP